MTGIALVLAVAAMLTGKPGTQIVPNGDCPIIEHQLADGCADIQGNVIHMRPDLAAMLTHLSTTQPYQSSWAVYVFCHEARHVRGTTNEKVADRWALAHVYRVARLLGASDKQARRMLYWLPWWTKGKMPR